MDETKRTKEIGATVYVWENDLIDQAVKKRYGQASKRRKATFVREAALEVSRRVLGLAQEGPAEPVGVTDAMRDAIALEVQRQLANAFGRTAETSPQPAKKDSAEDSA